MRPDGSQARMLDGRSAHHAKISPDGKRIAIVVDNYRIDGYGIELITMNLDRTGVHIVDEGDDFTIPHAPSWSPDSRRLSYEKKPFEFEMGRIVVATDQSNFPPQQTGLIGSNPGWQNNNQVVYFEGLSHQDTNATFITRFTVGAPGRTRLKGPNTYDHSWSDTSVPGFVAYNQFIPSWTTWHYNIATATATPVTQGSYYPKMHPSGNMMFASRTLYFDPQNFVVAAFRYTPNPYTWQIMPINIAAKYTIAFSPDGTKYLWFGYIQGNGYSAIGHDSVDGSSSFTFRTAGLRPYAFDWR
jgi:Tol biopolymer transport system component